MKPIKIIFFSLLILIPLLSLYRSCQITDSDHYESGDNIIALSGIDESLEIARINFDPKADNAKGAFKIKKFNRNLMIRESGKDFQKVKKNQDIVDRSVLDYKGVRYEYRQFPPKYQWKTICNQAISDLGIENRPTPFSISFDPKNRDHRIVLPKSKFVNKLNNALNKDVQFSIDQLAAILEKMLKNDLQIPLEQKKSMIEKKFQKELKIPLKEIQDKMNKKELEIPTDQELFKFSLIDCLLSYLPVNIRENFNKASNFEEKDQILDNYTYVFILANKDKIKKQLFTYLPRSLKRWLNHKNPDKKLAVNFKNWIHNHRKGQAGIYVRTLRLDDTFQIIDIIKTFSRDSLNNYVIYDIYKWPVIDRLTPEIPDHIKLIRNSFFAKKYYDELTKADSSHKKKEIVQKIIYNTPETKLNKLPDEEFLKIKSFLIENALSSGILAYILPPKEYSVFLSTIPKKWRIKSLVPDFITIERISKNGEQKFTKLSVNEPFELINNDRIDTEGFIFSFELRPVSFIVPKYLSRKELNDLGIFDTKTRSIIREDRQTFQLSLILKSLEKNLNNDSLIKAYLIPLSDENNDQINDFNKSNNNKFKLSRYKTNRIVTKNALYGLLNPSGPIPDSYSIPMYSELLNELQIHGLLKNINGYFHIAPTDLITNKSKYINALKNNEPAENSVNKIWYNMVSNADKSKLSKWSQILKKLRKTPVIKQYIQKANIALRPAGFSFKAKFGKTLIFSDPSWYWNLNYKWNSAAYRKDLCPPELSSYSNDWVWDNFPWEPHSNKKVSRFFAKKFNLPKIITNDNYDIEILACGEPALKINGIPINLVTKDEQRFFVRKWHVKDISQLTTSLKPGKINNINLSIVNSPPNRTYSNKVGLQVVLSKSSSKNKPVLKSDILWQSMAGYQFEWQTRESNSWENVIDNADYLIEFNELKNNKINDIPVIWSKESHGWPVYKSNQSKRYFRTVFNWDEGSGFLRIFSKDKIKVFLNGAEINLNNNTAIIEKIFFNTAKDNILAIEVENSFNQALSKFKSPSLYIDNKTGFLCMGINSFKQKNPYKKIDRGPRGKLIDSDQYSMPKLRLISGQDCLIKNGHEIPLAFSKTKKNKYIKDLLFIRDKAQNFTLFKLPCKNGYIDINWIAENRKINILKQGDGKNPNDGAFYKIFSVFKNYPYRNKNPWWEPSDPEKFDDLTPIDLNIFDKSLSESYYLNYDRVQIPLNYIKDGKHFIPNKNLYYTHYKPANQFSLNPDIERIGSNPGFKLGELIIFDLYGQEYHSFEIDDYSKLAFNALQKDQPVFKNLIFRFQANKNSISMKAMGFWPQYYIKINNEKYEKETVLKNGDIIEIGSYKFQFCKNDKGLLAGNITINRKSSRFYPPGTGLSHTTGVSFDFYQNGIERVMDSVLQGDWKTDENNNPPDVYLTLDDDLCRIVKDEVNRQIGIIDRKYAYKTASLENKIKESQTQVQKEFYSKQLTNISQSRQRFGMAAILNENSEILAAISEPSVESNQVEIQKALQETIRKEEHSLLINRTLHDARFRPGSSFKLVTAMAGFQYGEGQYQEAKELLEKGWFDNNTINLNQTKLNDKTVIVDLENHNQHVMNKGVDFQTALQRSYNVWFAYLGLLLNNSSLRNSYFLPGDVYHAFVSHQDRLDDFPLLKQAEKIGFNKNLKLYNLSFTSNYEINLDQILQRNPDVTDDPLTLAASRFPDQVFDQRSIARMAIGQHTVTETPVMNAMISLSLSEKLRGTISGARILKSIEFNNEKIAADAGPETIQACSPEDAKKIREAMRSVVLRGTGSIVFKACPLKYRLYGKTGTSERGKSGLFDNSWWTCFITAPDGKTYAIAACFPDAGEGAHHAADCVKRILDKMWRYYGWNISQNNK